MVEQCALAIVRKYTYDEKQVFLHLLPPVRNWNLFSWHASNLTRSCTSWLDLVTRMHLSARWELPKATKSDFFSTIIPFQEDSSIETTKYHFSMTTTSGSLEARCVMLDTYIQPYLWWEGGGGLSPKPRRHILWHGRLWHRACETSSAPVPDSGPPLLVPSYWFILLVLFYWFPLGGPPGSTFRSPSLFRLLISYCFLLSGSPSWSLLEILLIPHHHLTGPPTLIARRQRDVLCIRSGGIVPFWFPLPCPPFLDPTPGLFPCSPIELPPPKISS